MVTRNIYGAGLPSCEAIPIFLVIILFISEETSEPAD